MERPIVDQVVVITGASSGIGRATALMLAEQGASLVLAARNEDPLEAVAQEAIRRGGRAVAVATDVADPVQVERLAAETVSRFGGIDTWVNGAAVSVYSLFEDITPDEMRRVVEVALLGTMYGAKAALPHLRRSRGTLINIASVAGKVPIPVQAPYSAAKHGIIGFSDSLRMELDHERAGVTVTTILPYGINTPFFNHARSKLGVLPQPTPPAYRPQAVAEAIVWAAAHPTREIVVGGAAKSALLLRWLSPSLNDRLLTAGGLGIKLQKSNRPDDGVDALFAPAPGPYEVEGEFARLTIPGNGYTRTFEFHPARQRLAAAGLLLALAALVRFRR